MIVLDAGVVIALLDPDDAHHESAHELVRTHLDDDLLINPINLAEALVRPAQTGRLSLTLSTLTNLGLTATDLPPQPAARLAEIRAATGSKMPDCCALLTAEQEGAMLATFDLRLQASARLLGVPLV